MTFHSLTRRLILLAMTLVSFAPLAALTDTNSDDKDAKNAWTEVETSEKNGRIFLTVEAYTPLPLRTLWQHLTDYENLHSYHPSIVKSHILQQLPDSTLVETELKACVLFYCKRLKRVESVREQAPHQITAITLPEASDLRYGYQHWQLRTQGQGTRLTLHIEIEPKDYVIPWVGPMVIKYLLKRSTLQFLKNLEKSASTTSKSWT